MGAIADRARRVLQDRIGSGHVFNTNTWQDEPRSVDATDVAGMLEPVLTAIEELEARLDGDHS